MIANRSISAISQVAYAKSTLAMLAIFFREQDVQLKMMKFDKSICYLLAKHFLSTKRIILVYKMSPEVASYLSLNESLHKCLVKAFI